MKIIASLALAVIALSLGACAKDEPAYTTTSQSTGSSTSYSK